MKILNGLAESQVLQRIGTAGASAQISGEASTTGDLLATISNLKGVLKGWKRRKVGIVQRGKFSAILRGIPAGGPYRLIVEADKEKAIRRAFFVGDVWILAGQSNMEGCGDMTGRAKPHPLIRSFSMRDEWRLAEDPLHILAESPDACHNNGTQASPEAVAKMRREASKGVGAGIFFARDMMKESGVPQGLIATAHGGTSMTQWDPKSKDCMYASMLRSVRATGQPVAGVLWYQGESDANAEAAPLYTTRMKELVRSSRRDLQVSKLPWVIVQLSHFCELGNSAYWNSIQEQQRLLPKVIGNLETIASIDLVLDDSIHIGAAGFTILGSRLAIAMSQLRRGGKKRPPQLQSIAAAKAPASHIDVAFASVGEGLQASGNPSGFTLLDSDGKALPAIYKTTLHGDTVRLHCTRTTEGLTLHYGFGFSPYCNIKDSRGFALPAFGGKDFSKAAALLPYVKSWKMTGIVDAKAKLSKIPCPNIAAYQTSRTTPDAEGVFEGFVNQHAVWQGKSGHVYFSSSLQLDEPMKLRFLMGYDGPFRLWLDGKPFFMDMKGTNPCLPDQSRKIASLAAGAHPITIGMDLNGGAAWGFCLRFIREGLTKAQIQNKAYAVPAYSI